MFSQRVYGHDISWLNVRAWANVIMTWEKQPQTSAQAPLREPFERSFRWFKGAIYSIPCNDCDNEFIGQTKRQFGTRLKEH